VEALAGDGRSSLSDTAHAQPIHLPPTEAAHTARVSVEANAFLNVEWALPQIDNPLEVVVERDAGQGYREVLRENLRQGRTKFNDQEADFQQGAFGYRVFVMDTCGDYTPVGREGVSIFLTTRQVGQSVELNWTPYRGWEHGVAEYQVQYFDPNTQAFRTIASLGGQETRYRDDALVQLSGEACYRILATEWEGGLETSYSNESCAILSGQIMGANAFSPNEDGHNDEFALLGVFLESYQIVIYNRWGKKVFESQSMDNSWNGLDPQGQACAEGVYVYIAEGVGIDGQYIKRVGSVTLLR
jgi:gliding motility-associated-like protein